MIYTLRVNCVWGAYFEQPFERTIEVLDDTTLGKLHDIIQDLTGFDNDHLFTFFIARGPKGKRSEVVETDEWEERQDRLYEIPINRILPLPQNMKLFYLFDFGDDWTFQISKRGAPKEEEFGVKYPRVIKATGPKPVQYPRFG
jgi:hypothetical protein